jgi:beta-lactamase class A
MGRSLQKLLLEDALPRPKQELLKTWLLGNTTGGKRIRAGTPATWQVGDKTGSGDYGTANDLAILWPPSEKPIVLAIYLTQKEPKARWHDETIAAAARIMVEVFSTAKTN